MKQYNRKPWYRSRTIWINASVLVLCTAAENIDRLDGLLDGQLFKIIAFAVPVISVRLRFATTDGLHNGREEDTE